MRRQHDEFRKAGASVAAVSQGAYEQTRSFCESRKIPFPCLSDPGRSAYKAYGLDRGSVLSVMGPKVILKGVSAAARGHFLGRIVGDEFQMPGTFIVDKGTVRFAYYSRDAADTPTNDLLLSELGKLSGGTG